MQVPPTERFRSVHFDDTTIKRRCEDEVALCSVHHIVDKSWRVEASQLLVVSDAVNGNIR